MCLAYHIYFTTWMIFSIADNKNQLLQYMDHMKKAFQWLGIPLAPDKIEGPSTCITYLGIEIDSSRLTIQLPPSKLSDLHSTLLLWQHRRSCTKREILLLIGKLSFAAKVVKPGRMFLRRLIALSTTAVKLNHHIYLNTEAHADIEW